MSIAKKPRRGGLPGRGLLDVLLKSQIVVGTENSERASTINEMAIIQVATRTRTPTRGQCFRMASDVSYAGSKTRKTTIIHVPSSVLIRMLVEVVQAPNRIRWRSRQRQRACLKPAQ